MNRKETVNTIQLTASDFPKIGRSDRNRTLLYKDLPFKKGSRKPTTGLLDSVPCLIFRESAEKTIMNYLVKTYPELESERKYALEIFDCFVVHGMADEYYFTVDGVQTVFLAIKQGELWDGASHDLSQRLNILHYMDDYKATGGNVFMDDYGLC